MTYIGLVNANALYIPLADKSVQMVATSPPYWNLRDYETAKWTGGDESCDHKVGRYEYPVSAKQASNKGSAGHQARHVCPKCGAVRQDQQLGQEDQHDCLGWATGNPCNQCYVCHTSQWVKEVWRVLRSDGLFFLNLGDSYNGSGGAGGDYNKGGRREGQPKFHGTKAVGLQNKDLAGIPWRVALSLQASGWRIRNDCVWIKTNVMPEGGARDRFTRTHEYVFMFSKSEKYYFNLDAVREPYTEPLNRWGGNKTKQDFKSKGEQFSVIEREGKEHRPNPLGRNPRTAWIIPTAQYRGSHFATWPPKLVEKMIKAGSKEGDVVLDPFAGSGTTGLVARQLGRNFVGLDLSFDYLHDQARKRLELDKLSAWTQVKESV